MPDLYFDRRHLDNDGYTDQYRWHLADTNVLESDIDEAHRPGASSTAGSPGKSREPAGKSCAGPIQPRDRRTPVAPQPRGEGLQGATTGVGVASSHRL